MKMNSNKRSLLEKETYRNYMLLMFRYGLREIWTDQHRLKLLVLYLLCMRAVEKYRRRMVILAHNMVVRPLSHYAKKHNTSFTNHTLIRLKPRLKADRALEKKEGFTNDD